ncbi:hypothetical protein [Rhizohabitans arisaemae]|uniref:hypothetical protein n=1 Tax=Rhizohabitans arisaemae TaxID=2720610 RepID=UPI0024B285A4|nr:hypothetical protein [Rhizohabitans arisaemae]
MTTLESRYRLLMRAYPRSYRTGHGEELLGTLLEEARPSQRLPPIREATALVREGLRTRVLHSARGPAWVQGVHLGVLMLSIVNLAQLFPYFRSIPVWVGVSALAVLAVMRGRVRLALPLVLATTAKMSTLATGVQFPVDITLIPVFPDRGWLPVLPDEGISRALFSEGGPWAPLLSYGVTIAGLAVLAGRRQAPGNRSWWWPVLIPFVAGVDPAAGLTGVLGSPRTLTRAVLEIALVLFALWATCVVRDHRWAVAAGVYLIAASVYFVEDVFHLTRSDYAHLGILLFLTVVAAGIAYREQRHVIL